MTCHLMMSRITKIAKNKKEQGDENNRNIAIREFQEVLS